MEVHVYVPFTTLQELQSSHNLTQRILKSIAMNILYGGWSVNAAMA